MDFHPQKTRGGNFLQLGVLHPLGRLKNCIKNGYPFVFGFTVLTSFGAAAKDGTMVMPQPNDRVRGGHAVTGVGYDDFKQCFIVRWGRVQNGTTEGGAILLGFCFVKIGFHKRSM